MDDIKVIDSANKIKEVIELSLNPLSSKESRENAIKVQLEFMEQSDLCGVVGLYLYNQEKHPSLRICGLDMVCCYIKNRWYTVSPSSQDSIKKEVINIVRNHPIAEPNFIKEGVVKVFVEVVKRTWPQEWASLFSDLNGLQSHGDAQLELVLKIFKAISEDVNGMDDKIKAQRRKDMLQTLNSHMGGLFEFFLNTLLNKAMKLKTEKNKENLEIAHGAIATITVYASWINFEHLLCRDLELLKTLVLLLETDDLKYAACDCLSTIFERKTQHEERCKMMVLLSPDALGVITRVARSTNEAAKTDESEYFTLKRLVEAVTYFGTHQIANLWGEDRGFQQEPEGFPMFIKLLLDFCSLDSMLIDNMTLKCWSLLLSNSSVVSSKIGQSVLPTLLDTVVTKLTKDTDPFAKDSSEASVYNAYDFNDRDEYNENFAINRNYIASLLDVLKKLVPEKLFYHGLTQINNAVNFQPPPISADQTDEILMETKHYTAWDALTFYTKHTIHDLFSVYPKKVTEQMTMACNDSLRKLLQYKCEPCLFRFPLLRTMESLFLVFKSHQDHLMDTMQMLFALITIPVGDRKDKHQIKLQRFACYAFTSICKTIPKSLGAIFNDLQTFIVGLLEEKYLTNHQKGYLLEGLLRVSVELEENEQQTSFISKIITFIETNFNKMVIEGAIKDPLNLITLIGINDGERPDQMNEELSQFILALTCFHAITKACSVIRDLDEVVDDPSEEYLAQTAVQCSWVQPIINLLPKIFEIAKQYCLMWSMRDNIAPVVRNKLDLHDGEMKFDGEEDKERFNRGFHALSSIHDLLYSSLAECSRCVGPIMYSLPGFSDVIIDKLIVSWNSLPSNKLLKIWRTFIPTFTRGCPKKYRDITLAPFISNAIYNTFDRINKEWKKIKESGTNMTNLSGKVSEEDGQSKESDEVKQLRDLCKLSDEVILAICQFCAYKRKVEKKETEKSQDSSTIQIGDLGVFLLMCERTNLLIIQALFTSFTWPYTALVGRVCLHINAIVPKIFQPHQKVDPELANQLLIFLLQGLEQHGSDQSGISIIVNSILKFYLYMRLQYPGLVQIMLMVPTCTLESLKEFDLEYLTDESTFNESKKRRCRNQFKKLIEGACGKSLSVLYQDENVIKDLPKLPKRNKPDPSILSNDPEIVGLTQLFGN